MLRVTPHIATSHSPQKTIRTITLPMQGIGKDLVAENRLRDATGRSGVAEAVALGYPSDHT